MFIGQYISPAGDVAKSIKYSIAIPVVQYLLFLIYLSIYLCLSSFAKEVMFLVALVCLSVCLFVCLRTTLLKKSYERIGVKFNGGVLGSTMKN